MKISKRAANLVGVLGLVGISAPAIAFDWSQLVGGGSACMKDCIVAGAEVDDAATIAARQKIGTGPAAGLASDRRVLSDVVEVGKLDNGIKVYSFKYLWEDKVRVGVIAQDLTERPDTKAAVLTLANGLLGVDYDALGLRMATEAQWKQAGVAALSVTFKPVVNRSAKLDEPVQLFNKRPGM
ncbi:MAG: tail fiber domain-containing protein [Hyphomicrobiaceae bacterium]